MQIIQRMDMSSSRFEKPHGLCSRYHWNRDSVTLSDKALDRYYLSAMLGYKGQRGNSLSEIKYYLERSSASDGSQPKGTVYLMENGNILTEARQPWYSDICSLLKSMDRKCKVLSRGVGSGKGFLPEKRQDIIGLVASTRGF